MRRYTATILGGFYRYGSGKYAMLIAGQSL